MGLDTQPGHPSLPLTQHPELAQLSEPQESVICASGKQSCQQGRGKWAPALCHSVPSSCTAWVHGHRLQGSVCVQGGIPTIPDYTSYGPETDSTEILSAGETAGEALNTCHKSTFSVRKTTTTNSCLRKPLQSVPGEDMLDNLTPMDLNLSPQLDKQTKSLKNLQNLSSTTTSLYH